MIALSDALASLDGRREFAVKKYQGLVVLNYIIQMPDSFEGIRREFRGITFDETTGEIISLPFHKFFNLNQAEETQWHRVKDMKGVVYEKLDGSMIHFFKHQGQYFASTRMSSETPQAQAAYKLALPILNLIAEEIDNGYTPCFEYVAPSNRIVVAYPKPRLVYLNSRHRQTGTYRFNESFPDKARRFDFSFQDVNSYLNMQDAEGYVVHLDNGVWLKVKCDWYLERHKAVDALMRPAYHLYQAALADAIDDMTQLAPHFADRLRQIEVEAKTDLLNLAEEVSVTCKRIKDELAQAFGPMDEREYRKQFALRCQQNHRDNFGLLMRAFCGSDEEMREEAKKKLMERYRLTYRDPIYADLADDA